MDGVSPLGRRVATFVAACLAFDLYGYAVYHAWQTRLIGPTVALILLTGMAALGIGALILAPGWLQRARGEVPQQVATEPAPLPQRGRWWLPWLLSLASIVAGVGLAAWGRLVLPQAPRSTLTDWIWIVALDSACIGLCVFTAFRLRRPGALRPEARRFALALGVIGTIDGAIRVVGGLSLARIFSAPFPYALVQMAVIYVPLCLWAGYIWSRIMAAIFTPPKR